MENNNSRLRRPDHRLRPLSDKGRFFKLRQWLNGIFILSALIGVFIYVFSKNPDHGTYIILGAMVFKIVESVLRMLK